MNYVADFISEWWAIVLAFVVGWIACTATQVYLLGKEDRARATAKPNSRLKRIEYADNAMVLADKDAQMRLELAIFRNADGARPRPLDECIRVISELRDYRDDARTAVKAVAKRADIV